MIGKVTRLSNPDRPKVLVFDDSSYDRNRSKSVELLACCYKERVARVFSSTDCTLDEQEIIRIIWHEMGH